MKLESERYSSFSLSPFSPSPYLPLRLSLSLLSFSFLLSLVGPYHGNIRDRAEQKSKAKKERLAVNITVTNRELPGSWDERLRYRDVMIDIDLAERELNPSNRVAIQLTALHSLYLRVV